MFVCVPQDAGACFARQEILAGRQPGFVWRRGRPSVCQCLLAPLEAARQCYKDGRCGGRRGCLWLELWIRRPSLTEPKGGVERGTSSEADADTENTHPSQRRRRMGHPQRLGRIRRRVDWYVTLVSIALRFGPASSSLVQIHFGIRAEFHPGYSTCVLPRCRATLRPEHLDSFGS